jgi:hypothetical protein
MTLWQRLRRLLGLSYVVRFEPGWEPPPDEHGNTTLSDGTPIRLAGYPEPTDDEEYWEFRGRW